MKKVLIVLIIFAVLIASSLFVIKKYLWVNVIFTNKDTRAVNVKPNKFLTEAYISFVLQPKLKGIWIPDNTGKKIKIYPNIISIFTTDKMRTGNPESIGGRLILGSSRSSCTNYGTT